MKLHNETLKKRKYLNFIYLNYLKIYFVKF